MQTEISDGKTLIADAITAKGVSTPAESSYQVMANNIKNIKSKPTKTQTVLQSVYVSSGCYETRTFQFTNLNELTGITAISVGTVYFVVTSISISGNIASLVIYNHNGQVLPGITASVSVTGIGY